MFVYFLMIFYVPRCFGYENLAFRRSTQQSSTYIASWSSDKAVDGDSRTLVHSSTCAITKNEQKVWWRVDLQAIRSISYIRIYYRTDTPTLYANHFSTRFAGFYVYISNTTNRLDGFLCHHDNKRPPAVLKISCVQHGRYVIYVNERLPWETYPTFYSKENFAELCEVEVYGCDAGFYGENCDNPCPDNCKTRRCDIRDGACFGCKAGFMKRHCNKECYQTYGVNCEEHCGFCANHMTCNRFTGDCEHGCQPGWRGPKCLSVCANGTYGPGCSKTCSKNCKQCHHEDGKCYTGCLPGWWGEYCDKPCEAERWGPNCGMHCSGMCSDKKPCNHITGECNVQCTTGWGGRLCDQAYLSDGKSAGSEPSTSNAGYAMDKNDKTCTVTNGKQKAKWFVDLGGTPKIHHVKIQYRNNDQYYTTFAGFFLYVSNTSDIANATLCYHKIQISKTDLSEIIDIECIKYARYVIFYNERIQGKEYPSFYSKDTVIELCEVTVFGCMEMNGGNCVENCPTNCMKNKCDIESGTCLKCLPGYQKKTCTECGSGTFGTNCLQKCSPNCRNSCHHVTGVCIDKCKSGWSGDMCDTPCENNMYGRNCELQCSRSCAMTSCYPRNGTCIKGCKDGWTGSKCDSCSANRFGEDCLNECNGNCLGGSCHHVDGHCLSGCVEGWKGLFCNAQELRMEHSGADVIAMGVGIAVAAVVIVGLIVVIVVFKRRQKEGTANNTSTPTPNTAPSVAYTSGVTFTDSEMLYDNTSQFR